MALPVPSTVSDPTVVQRVKFMQDGSGFQFLVAEWPTNIPAADPTTTAGDGSLTDPNRYGDDAAATYIMYRIVEGRPTLNSPSRHAQAYVALHAILTNWKTCSALAPRRGPLRLIVIALQIWRPEPCSSWSTRTSGSLTVCTL